MDETFVIAGAGEGLLATARADTESVATTGRAGRQAMPVTWVGMCSEVALASAPHCMPESTR